MDETALSVNFSIINFQLSIICCIFVLSHPLFDVMRGSICGSRKGHLQKQGSSESRAQFTSAMPSRGHARAKLKLWVGHIYDESVLLTLCAWRIKNLANSTSVKRQSNMGRSWVCYI